MRPPDSGQGRSTETGGNVPRQELEGVGAARGDACRVSHRLCATMLKGRRLPGGFLRPGAFRPGDYQVVTAGSDNVLGLWVVPPCGGRLVHVTDCRYTEHRDGTVSVEGTITADGWQGLLKHGIWDSDGDDAPTGHRTTLA